MTEADAHDSPQKTDIILVYRIKEKLHLTHKSTTAHHFPDSLVLFH